jgi:glyceraldehyde 3-phosphate dehydrogenase
MSVRVGINGFGRIGKSFLRAALAQGADLEVVAVNDVTTPEVHAHLLKHDSILGTFPGEVVAEDDALVVDGRRILVYTSRQPAELPWGELDVDVVVESTGRFTDRKDAAGHLAAGARRVVISAPATDADATFVMGVNDDTFDPAAHLVVSNASCTTNCFVPMVKVLDDAFGVVSGLMTTVHAYTSDQNLVDFPHRDLRRARAAAINVVPSSTGAARATGLVLQAMQGRLDGTSLRVPLPVGSRSGRRSAQGLPRLLRSAARLPRHRRLDGLVRLRRAAHDGPAHRRRHDARQGLRLVRQRVGLLEPPRGPGPPRRRPLSGGRRRRDRRPADAGRPRGPPRAPCARARRLQRPADARSQRAPRRR